MAAEKHIHSEDIVRLLKTKDGSNKIGLVLRTGSNISDSEESSESSEEDSRVKSGEVLVCWYPSGHEEVISESKVCSFSSCCVPAVFVLVPICRV